MKLGKMFAMMMGEQKIYARTELLELLFRLNIIHSTWRPEAVSVLSRPQPRP